MSRRESAFPIVELYARLVLIGLNVYVERSGPRILDTPLSEILMHVQAAKTGAA